MDENRVSSLQAAARTLLSVLAPRLARVVAISISFGDRQTASTDGHLHILMPNDFLGAKLPDDAVITLGLLVHELGHWVQPTEKLLAVQQKERIPHWLTNIALDVHGESFIAGIFPAMVRPLQQVRAVVEAKNVPDFKRKLHELLQKAVWTDADKRMAVQLGMLISRFQHPLSPYSFIPFDRLPVDAGDAINELSRFAATRVAPAELPRVLRRYIKDHPFLRLPQGGNEKGIVLPWPGVQTAAGDPVARIFLDELRKNAGGMKPSSRKTYVWRAMRGVPPQHAYPEAKALARRLAVRFRAKQGGLCITAPGRLNRLEMARGHPVPFDMALKGRASPAPQLALALDASGSMMGDDMINALKAAQAIALAVKAGGGDVKSVLFSSEALYREDEKLAFARYHWVWGAFNSGTDFRFLQDAWRRWPHHFFLVLTDGHGHAPLLLPTDKARTVVVYIGSGRGGVVPWARQTILLRDAKELAAVFATLIPARFTRY
jgi:hypothetical protein